jgi:hypothetical protein
MQGERCVGGMLKQAASHKAARFFSHNTMAISPPEKPASQSTGPLALQQMLP